MIEVEGLKRSMLVRARLLQWRLRSRRRPPARWFCGGAGSSTGRDQAAATMSSSRVPSSNANAAAFIDNDYPAPPKLNMYVVYVIFFSFIPCIICAGDDLLLQQLQRFRRLDVGNPKTCIGLSSISYTQLLQNKNNLRLQIMSSSTD